MPKVLFIAGLIILNLVTLISVTSNYQSSAFQVKDERSITNDLFINPKFAWSTILLEAPQYQPTISKGSNHVVNEHITAISDSTVVGIVLDEPSSALIVVDGNNEVKSFKLGEGWLEKWVIKSLQADAVNWLNTENQKQYAQPLFDLTIPKTAMNKKVNNKNGRRK